jgi:YbgC/YbaW family acyl-CoA thioester hydrolase
MFKNLTTFRVEWGETDTAGIIFYPNYYRWFDRGTHELFRAAGMPISELSREGFAQPIVECSCRFSVPLYYDDLVTLESVVTEVRGKIFRIEHTVRRGETVTGVGFEVRAWVTKDTEGKFTAVAIPPQYSARLTNDA